MRYFARQLDEIASLRSLRVLGAILALLHIAAIEWWFHTDALGYLSSAAEPICWPLFPSCAGLHALSSYQLETLFRLLELASVAVALGFARPATVRLGYFGLWALTLVKLALMTVDFRTRMNQHYMLLFITAAFLLVTNRPLFIRILVVLFYVAAAFLKLNRDWLSGASLYRPLWLVPAAYVPLAIRYSIVLELAFAWGLLARTRWLFWAAFVQLVAFHLLSSPVVGFFYPLVCLGFLTFVAVERWDGPRPPFVPRRQLGGALLLAAFVGLQLIPRLVSDDPALSGEGRLWALHMFDGRIECRGQLTLTHPDGHREPWPMLFTSEARTACDPIVFWGHARNACRARTEPDADFDLLVLARHASDPAGVERRLIDVHDFCRADPPYHVLRHNPWILP